VVNITVIRLAKLTISFMATSCAIYTGERKHSPYKKSNRSAIA